MKQNCNYNFLGKTDVEITSNLKIVIIFFSEETDLEII